MGLINVLIVVALVGFIVWLLLQFKFPDPFPKIIIGVAVIGLLFWLLKVFGLFNAANVQV